jgi:hypothetical protein
MSENTGPLGSMQTSFIAMAKEPTKKRVDVAATRAENLDADKDIVGNEIHSAKNN